MKPVVSEHFASWRVARPIFSGVGASLVVAETLAASSAAIAAQSCVSGSSMVSQVVFPSKPRSSKKLFMSWSVPRSTADSDRLSTGSIAMAGRAVAAARPRVISLGLYMVQAVVGVAEQLWLVKKPEAAEVFPETVN